MKKGVLKNLADSQENTCARVTFSTKLQLKAYYFIQKETLACLFCCEFCEVCKNTYFYRAPPAAASVKM